MMRGAFANLRIRNRMAGEREGWWTEGLSEGEVVTLFESRDPLCATQRPAGRARRREFRRGLEPRLGGERPGLLGVRA